LRGSGFDGTVEIMFQTGSAVDVIELNALDLTIITCGIRQGNGPGAMSGVT